MQGLFSHHPKIPGRVVENREIEINDKRLFVTPWLSLCKIFDIPIDK
jgi:hypothetical protein